jgi:hypothetical protein
MIYKTLAFASLIASGAGFMVPPPAPLAAGAAVCSSSGPSAVHARAWPCMQEAADSSVSDFTDDLLEALTTEEEPVEQEAYVAKAAEGVELEPMPSFVNAESVEAMRSK